MLRITIGSSAGIRSRNASVAREADPDVAAAAATEQAGLRCRLGRHEALAPQVSRTTSVGGTSMMRARRLGSSIRFIRSSAAAWPRREAPMSTLVSRG